MLYDQPQLKIEQPEIKQRLNPVEIHFLPNPIKKMSNPKTKTKIAPRKLSITHPSLKLVVQSKKLTTTPSFSVPDSQGSNTPGTLVSSTVHNASTSNQDGVDDVKKIGVSPQGVLPPLSSEEENNYLTTLTHWIERYKNYPVWARNERLVGSALVKLYMTREGMLENVVLENGVSSKPFEDAALEMVKNAAPYPIPPERYKLGDKILEFTIPINFTLR